MNFSEWLHEEMRSRDWSIADLAREAGVSPGALGNVLRETRKAGADLCSGIAHALKIPPEFVFQKAGLLPEKPDRNKKIDEAIYLIEKLNESNQKDAIQYLRYRLQVQEQKGDYSTNGEPVPAE